MNVKKKIIATLLAGALVGASAVSFAACGDGVSMPKGNEVTAEEWAEFFETTLELKNYTMEYSVNATSTIKGTIKTPYDYSNPEKKKEQSVEGDSKSTMSGTVLYDEENKKAYSESKTTMKANSKADDEKGTMSGEESDKFYYERKEEGKYWKTSYSYEQSKSETPEGKASKEEEKYWSAGTTNYFADSYIEDMISESTFYVTKEENAESENITALYDKFTYFGGVYTATLYRKVNIYSGFKDLVECTVLVSFNKAEKCVVGYSIKTVGEGNLKEDSTYSSYDFSYTYKGESVYAVTNIRTTDVSKKVNKDVTKALDKAKADAAEAANA